jgi:pilus assembly protein CpaB
MDTTSKWLLGAGMALAVLVGLAVYAVVNSAQGFGRATAVVVVARQDIPERTLFTGANVGELLTTRRLPADLIPQGALTQPSEAVGKANTTRLVADEIVLGTADRLVGGEGQSARAAATIPRDKVALAIPATESISVAGALQAGDRVDVIATWTRQNTQPITQTIFQDVSVFSVGHWQNGNTRQRGSAAASGGNGAGNTITLLLDYQQAMTVEYLVQTGGHVSLAMRRFDQSGVVATEPITPETLGRRYFGVDGELASR